MKKLFLLTSILALAACGGGGGGGGGGDTPTPRPSRAVISDDAIASNSAITSMATEVLVPKSSGEVIARRSGSVNYEGNSYTSYRLDDVKFRVATGGGNDAFLKFKMDKEGKVDALTMSVGSENQKMYRRNDESADFRGIVYEYVVLDNSATAHDDYSKSDRDTLVRLVFSPENDPTSYSTLSAAAAGKCPADRYCRWDRIDQAFRITSKGNGLTYSDFGMLQTANFGKYKGVTADTFAEAKTHNRDKNGTVTDAVESWDDIVFDDQEFEVFGGGYKVSALQHRPTEDMTFTGKAIGSVYATDSDTHPDNNLALVDNAATLTFDAEHGTETLAMNFTNWYDVTVTKTGDSNHIAFSDFEGTDDYKFRSGTEEGLERDNFTTSYTSGDGSVKTEGLLDMGYYGVTGPEEATGVVRFKETTVEGAGNDAIQYEREFRAGYGMTPTAAPEP